MMTLNTLADRIPLDKLRHYAVGALLCALAALIGSPLLALAVVTVTAVAKELYDHFSATGTLDWFDALATVLGGLTVALPAIVHTI